MKRVITIIALSGVVFSGCELAPPLRISSDGAAVVIGVETLGEYPTSIKRIKISEARSPRTLLELRADGDRSPQIWNITLGLGENSISSLDLPEPELYRVVAPSTGSSFILTTETTYLVEVWGESGKSTSAEFRF